MTEELEQLLLQMTQPDNAIIQQATIHLKQAFKDPAIIPALCAVMGGSQNPQIRQSAAVMLRLRVKKRWTKISPADRESLKAVVLQAFMQETEHTVQHSLSQLCAVMVKHETPDSWPALLQLLNQATESVDPHDRQVGLLLLNKVVESNPEPFQPHYCQLLQLFSTVLQDHNNPTALYYCILTLTAITAYTGTEHMNQMRSIIPSLIVALKHLIKADQSQASEAMEVFNELMESEVSIIVPHVADVVRFCLEVGSDTTLTDSLRVKALSCISFLIKLKSKAVLKQKLLVPILQAIFPILTAAPPPGEEDPEDAEDGDSADNDNPKHCAAQIIDTMALRMPPEKLFQHLMPLTQTCLASDNPYQRKGGLMCLAVLAEGCADHIRTKMLSSVLQTVCRSLSDGNQVVRSAALFALGQFSEHLQPDVSKYCEELMPLLLGYLSSLDQAKVGHITKAFYALENFLENLGAEIEPYLPTLMDTMLSALNSTDSMKIKELTVSAIGAIANAGKELLVPYFPPVIESLKGFLTTTTEEMRSLQTQSLDTLSVLARTIGKDVFSPLAAECVQLGLKLTDSIDDPDLRRCTYSLYSAVSTVCPDCLTPHLTPITTIMLLALKSNEGITAHLEEDKTFVLLDDDEDDKGEEKDADEFLEDEPETDVHDVAGFSVENSYIDEKEDACDALGEIAFNTGAVFQPYLQSSFQQVFEMRDYPHEDVRRAAFGAMGQFCRGQHKVWQENPTDMNHQALLKMLDVVLPCFLETVRTEHERQVVMGILETMNGVIKSCKEKAFEDPTRLKEVSKVICDVLKKKTACQDSDDADDEEQQAEYDAMLQEFAGEGIPLLAASVPADSFAPFLNDLLPLILSKTKSSCTVAEKSFSLGTIGEILQALISAPEGQRLAGKLHKRLLPVLVTGVKDGDPEVRNNSVFGLGCLAQAAGSTVVPDYPMMLSVFSNLLAKESDRRVIDNLCAALCRMILSNVEVVPLEQVVPALVARLPLKEDMEENKTVFSCLAMLYSHSPALIVTLMKPIVSSSCHVLGNKEVDQETKSMLATFLKQVAQQHAADFQAAATALPGEQQAHLSAAIGAS
ncbi:importin-4 isoform X1 [Dunckerocampus dactyliophorus]|uniref:importin-4 isoform X1 n=1 Tax=Dunckerocampus dactyliophorus TaxID=161453 RepID=UPI002405E686|nr:importin-4 isoform X1 [Dunckerocampus dactyliophorus]XP_054622269.1 importin-4 isoform X1 [Dunckerocampus dactyliophorus]